VKNPFAAMALMAAAMMEAFRENKYRDMGIALPKDRTRSRIPGPHRPSGSKHAMRFYKAKHGMKASSLEEAHGWYRSYLAEQDAKVRAAEAERKRRRIARQLPALKKAA
jgi:hypothetical protein